MEVKHTRKPLMWLTFISVLREGCLIPDGDVIEELGSSPHRKLYGSGVL